MAEYDISHERGRRGTGKPFKPTYLKTIQSELSALFNHAVRFYELKENPVIKAGPLGKGKADEMNFWTKEEYLKFIEAVKEKPISYYAFQIFTGVDCVWASFWHFVPVILTLKTRFSISQNLTRG